MSELRNICLPGNNSILQTTLSHETGKIAFRKAFSWLTVAKVYQAISMGLIDSVSEEDAKGYTKVLFLLFSATLLGSILEGGEL